MGARDVRAGWWCAARRNVNGAFGRGVGVGGGGVSGQPRARRMSAEPEDDVDALFPCCGGHC
jgi:hypothetical protein